MEAHIDNIRESTNEDYCHIPSFTKDCEDIPGREISRLGAYQNRYPGSILIYDDGEDIKGVVIHYINENVNSTFGVVEALYVKPEYHGHGIATCLLQQVSDNFSQYGIDVVYLEKRAAMDLAHQFFEDHGMIVISKDQSVSTGVIPKINVRRLRNVASN